MDFQTTVGELPKKVQELNLPPDLTIQTSFRDKDMPKISDHLIPKEQKPRNYRRDVWQEMQRKYHGNEDSEAMIQMLKAARNTGKDFNVLPDSFNRTNWVKK